LHLSELSMRLPSIIFGIGSILLLFITVLALFDYRTALVTSAIALFHPMIQFHSQYARFYSMLLFCSVLILFFTYCIKTIFSQQYISRWSKLGLVLLGLFLWLPMMVHLTAFFVYIFTALVVVDILTTNPQKTRTILYLLIPATLIGIFVFGNQFIFLISRLRFGPVVGAPGISNVVAATFQLVNSFGLSLFAVLPISIYMAITTKNKMLIYLLITTLLSLVCYVAASYKIGEIRDDYLLAVLPIMIVTVSYGIHELCNKSTHLLSYSNIILVTTTVLIIVGLLPSFISTCFVDGLRLNWKAAFEYIDSFNENNSKLDSVNIFSQSPGIVEFYSSKSHAQYTCLQIGYVTNKDLIPDNSFVIIPIRRGGADTRRFTDDILSFVYRNGNLLKIVGKDRLDNHLCKLAIYEISRF